MCNCKFYESWGNKIILSTRSVLESADSHKIRILKILGLDSYGSITGLVSGMGNLSRIDKGKMGGLNSEKGYNLH